MSNYGVGIDLGGSSVKLVALRESGEILQQENREFDTAAPLHFANTINDLLSKVEEKLKLKPSFIGLAAPGLASPDHRWIAFMPGRLRGLEKLDWSNYLNVHFKIPVLNDAHAALLGEAWVGAGRGLRNVVMITLGTGVGGAAIVDGRLLQGSIGRAGHLGHNCLDMDAPADVTGIPGSIEYFIGNYNIQQRTDRRFQTTHALVESYRAGDPQAAEFWLKSVRALACSISSYINILDPEAIIIGGGVARSGPALFEPLEKFLRPIEWQPGGHSVKLLHAELGEFAGAIGAAKYALNQ